MQKYAASPKPINPFSAKSIFGRKKKIRKFYSYFSFYARENNFKQFFLANWLNFFIEPQKKIENPAKYELFLPKPVTLTLFSWH